MYIWSRHGEFSSDPHVDLLLLFNTIPFLSPIVVGVEESTNVMVSGYPGNVNAQFHYHDCDLVGKLTVPVD